MATNCEANCCKDDCLGDEKYASAMDTQIGGNHYKYMRIQPIEYIQKNNLSYAEGCVVKYVSRWQNKGGVEDLKKAKHLLEILIEQEGEDKDHFEIEELIGNHKGDKNHAA